MAGRNKKVVMVEKHFAELPPSDRSLKVLLFGMRCAKIKEPVIRERIHVAEMVTRTGTRRSSKKREHREEGFE